LTNVILGLLIIDISPFALNFDDTIINYHNISKNQYLKLMTDSLPFYFEQKIKAVSRKKSGNVNVFFRYARVRKRFSDAILDALISYNFIKSAEKISDISKRGGNMDRLKFEQRMK